MKLDYRVLASGFGLQRFDALLVQRAFGPRDGSGSFPAFYSKGAFLIIWIRGTYFRRVIAFNKSILAFDFDIFMDTFVNKLLHNVLLVEFITYFAPENIEWVIFCC